MSVVEILLYPIIFIMRAILEVGYWAFASYGLAIIFLSLVVTAATHPLSRIAAKVQEKENIRQERMRPEIAAAKAKYRGERQFREIESIYERYNYHPIQSIREIFGVLLQIPFLLAALLLLLDYELIKNASFGPIADLSRPDALIPLPSALPISSVNLLPFLTAMLSVVAGYFMSNVAKQSRWKGNVVSIVILAIIYPLPAAIVLYWTFNNIWLLLKAAPITQLLRPKKT